MRAPVEMATRWMLPDFLNFVKKLRSVLGEFFPAEAIQTARGNVSRLPAGVCCLLHASLVFQFGRGHSEPGHI